jgi:predicted Zn finger-like uncharacterized protein
MVKVECDGCKAPYQIDEKRIPPTGLKMRCPKCGTNILVTKPSAPGGDDHDLPAVAAPKAAPPGPGRPPPRPPPKAPPAAPAAADDNPKTRSGFGEIDLMVDLPAPAAFDAAADQADLPAPVAARPGPPGRPPPPPPRHAPPPPPAAPVFGEVDLPAVHPGPDANPFGVVDLPAVPAVGGLGGGFGELDLPMAASPAPAPAAPPPPPPRMRGRTVNFGDIDLPSVPDVADLPQPAASRGFGEIDLPLVADDGGLPMAASPHTGLPMAAPGAGLPMAAHGAGLPMAAPGGGLPMAAPGAGLPMPAMGGGLPMAAPGGGLPMAAMGTGLPQPAFGDLPAPVPGGGLPMAAPGGGLPAAVGDEISLGEAPRSRASAFDDSDRAVPQQAGEEAPLGSVGIDLAGPARQAVGDEVDLSAAPVAGPGGDVAQPQRRARPEGEATTKRGGGRQVAIAAVVLVVLTGGAMTLVPSIGPFGANFISDQINAKSNAATYDDLRKATGAQQDEDTAGSVAAALEKCKGVQHDMPRYAPTKAYCAFVAVDRGLRFGRRSEDEAYAKQLLKDGGADGSTYAVLAQAGLDALAGQAGKARGVVQGLAQKLQGDVDVAVTLANLELMLKSGPDAVKAWNKAVTLHKSARTQYGLARAQAAVGDMKSAVESARAVITAAPKHAGARLLLASLIWHESGKEDEAVAKLKEVTDQGKGAGDAELIEAYTLLGRIHLSKSRISAAEASFGAALKIDPLAIGALVGNAELFYRSGRYAEALSRFEGATKADADSVLAKVGLCKTLIAMERVKEAKDMLKKLREQKPGDALVTLWLGRADEALGNRKDAETEYGEAIKLGENKPEVVDAYVALAHLLSGIGRTDDANAKLADASKKFPDSPALHRARGEVALQMGRYEEAKTELEAALGKEEDLYARIRLGIALRRMKRYDEAAKTFDKIAEIDKDYPGLALERGVLYQEMGQSDKALEAYRAALQKAPNDPDLKLRVAATQVIAGHAKDAYNMLLEVKKERPNSAEVNHFLGRALLVRRTNLAEAFRYLEAAANADGNRAEYQLYVGWAANELQQTARATTALNRAIELDHELGDAYWQRGVLLQKQGASLEALKDLQTALEKNPSRHEAYATMALCYADLQKWPEAERAWRRAIAGDESNPEWHYRLGKQLAGQNNNAAAGPELEKALELAEGSDMVPPNWLAEAHFLTGEALKSNPREKAKAIEHYKKYLEMTPQSPYASDAKKALAGLGVKDL